MEATSIFGVLRTPPNSKQARQQLRFVKYNDEDPPTAFRSTSQMQNLINYLLITIEDLEGPQLQLSTFLPHRIEYSWLG